MTEQKKKPFGSHRNDVDMTEGSIVGSIIRFTIPLLIGNLFQQLYNLVDTWVIAKWGDAAGNGYAAVGSIGPITNILIGLFLGLSSGAGVVIAQYYGAKDYDKVRKAVHTSVMMTVILGVVISVASVATTPLMVRLMLRADESSNEIYPYAVTYLIIYFSGAMGLMLYNIGSGILRAVGDSKRPFYFLVVSALLNIALDLLFVIAFGMGVAGVALATVISQFISAILTFIVLFRTSSCVKIVLRELKMDMKILGKIVKIGIPAAIQMAITAFSNVFVQSYIANIDPVSEMTAHLGGWTTYSKVDQFIFLPMQSLALAATTFVGQNLGKNDEKRARKGMMVSYYLATATTVTIIAVVLIFTRPLALCFQTDELIVENAVLFLKNLTPFYLLCCVNQVFTASLRGAGKSIAPMVIMLCAFVGFRQLYLFVVSNYISNSALAIGMSYPAGWAVCCIATLIYYQTCDFSNGRITDTDQ